MIRCYFVVVRAAIGPEAVAPADSGKRMGKGSAWGNGRSQLLIGVAVAAVLAGLVLPFIVGDEPTSSVAMVQSAPSTTGPASESAATPNVEPISGLGTGAAAPTRTTAPATSGGAWPSAVGVTEQVASSPRPAGY